MFGIVGDVFRILTTIILSFFLLLHLRMNDSNEIDRKVLRDRDVITLFVISQ